MITDHIPIPVYEVYKDASKSEYRAITLFSLTRINFFVKRWYYKNKFIYDITKCSDYPKYKKIYKLLYNIKS